VDTAGATNAAVSGYEPMIVCVAPLFRVDGLEPSLLLLTPLTPKQGVNECLRACVCVQIPALCMRLPQYTRRLLCEPRRAFYKVYVYKVMSF